MDGKESKEALIVSKQEERFRLLFNLKVEEQRISAFAALFVFIKMAT